MGGSISEAIVHNLNHWADLTAHMDDGSLPTNYDFAERQFRPWQMGRKALLYIGSELTGQRAALVVSLMQSAKLNPRPLGVPA